LKELILLAVASAVVIVAAFAYFLDLNLRVLPRSIRSPWYRTALGALAFCFCVMITFLFLACFWDEALLQRRTHVAHVIGDVEIWLVYVGLFALGVSILALIGGGIMGLLKRRNLPKTK